MVFDPRLECATLQVPLDHADPSGSYLELALIRDPAPDAWKRSGAVLVNPGGPGGSGFDYVAATAATMRAELGIGTFDIIGFDPRGVDRSGGLRCLSDDELDIALYLDPSPDTPEEQAQLDETPTLAEACARVYGDTLRHYSTESTARDVDLIRQALGDEQITFYGISYGTYLAALTATLFPERVRAMVLDSAVSPEHTATIDAEAADGTSTAADRSFVVTAVDTWAAWCTSAPESCGYSRDDPSRAWMSLFDRLDAEGLRTTDGRSVNHRTLTDATLASLSMADGWPLLGAALADAEAGIPDLLVGLADQANGRRADGTYTTLMQSFAIITCASSRSAYFGEPFADLTRGAGCDGLTSDVDPPAIRRATGIPTVIIGGEQDPVTPVSDAIDMFEALGPEAIVVRYEGPGHGLVELSSCLSGIAAALIEELSLPARGTGCQPDPDIERPTWWTDLLLDGWLVDVGPDPELLTAMGWSSTDYYLESGVTSLGLDELLTAADEAILGRWGTVEVGRWEFAPGVEQLNYRLDGDLLSLIVIERNDVAEADLGPLQRFFDDGQTLVLLVHTPD